MGTDYFITYCLIYSNLWIFTGNREIIPYMFIFLGGMALTISLEEILKQQTGGSVLALLAGAALYLLVSQKYSSKWSKGAIRC